MNETNDAITSNATLEGFELPLMPLREVVMSPHSIMPSSWAAKPRSRPSKAP